MSALMDRRTSFVAFVEECRDVRDTLEHMVNRLEAGLVGADPPVMSPKAARTAAALILSLKQSMSAVDAAIIQQEAAKNA
jgi:hypothetical protein